MDRTEKINNCTVKIPKLEGLEQKKKWRGSNIFSARYFVLANLGKRRSGKTTLINTIVQNFATKNMILFFFVPTFYRDASYVPIREYLDEKGIVYQHYYSVKEDGVNNVEVFMEQNAHNEDSKNENEKEGLTSFEEEPIKPCLFDTEKKSEKKERKKKQPPLEYMFFFDDMPDNYKDKQVCKLIKLSRHFKSKIILSTQSTVDLDRSIYQQCDYVALFRNFNEDNLDKLYIRMEPWVDLEEFKRIYHRVTDSENRGIRNFLLVDRNDDIFRINLNKKLIL